MPRPKGIPKTGGRKRGTPNKNTAEVRDMLRGALEDAGGRDYLKRCATDSSDKVRAAFLSLVGKLVPSEVNAKLSGEITAVISRSFVGPPDA